MPVKSTDQEQNQSIVNCQRIAIGQPGSAADRVCYPGGGAAAQIPSGCVSAMSWTGGGSKPMNRTAASGSQPR